jgi:hypothetical protein
MGMLGETFKPGGQMDQDFQKNLGTAQTEANRVMKMNPADKNQYGMDMAQDQINKLQGDVTSGMSSMFGGDAQGVAGQPAGYAGIQGAANAADRASGRPAGSSMAAAARGQGTTPTTTPGGLEDWTDPYRMQGTAGAESGAVAESGAAAGTEAGEAPTGAGGVEGQPGAEGEIDRRTGQPVSGMQETYDMNTPEGQQEFSAMYDGDSTQTPDWNKLESTQIPPEIRGKMEEDIAYNERRLGSLTEQDMQEPGNQEAAKKALKQKMMLKYAGTGTNPQQKIDDILRDGISHEELTGEILNDPTALAQVTERAAAAGHSPEEVKATLEKATTPEGKAQAEAESPGIMESIISFFTDMDPGMQLLLAAGAGMAIGGAMGMGGMGGIATILGVLGIGGAIMGGIFGGKGGSGEATEPGKPPAEGGATGGAYTGENSRGSVTGGPANPPVEVNGVMMYDQGDGTMGPEEPLAEPFANPPADGTEAPPEGFSDGSTGAPEETPVEGGAGEAAPAESAFPGDADGNGEFNPQEISAAMGDPAVIKSMVNHPNAQAMFQKAYHAEPPNKEFRAKVMKIRGFKPEEMDMVVDGFPGVFGVGAQPGLVEQLGVDRPTAVKMFQLAQNL